MSQDLKKPQLALKDDSLTFSAALLADFIPLLSAIFQDSPDCVAIYDMHARVHYANKSLEGTWGYSLHYAQNAQQTNSDCLNRLLTR